MENPNSAQLPRPTSSRKPQSRGIVCGVPCAPLLIAERVSAAAARVPTRNPDPSPRRRHRHRRAEAFAVIRREAPLGTRSTCGCKPLRCRPPRSRASYLSLTCSHSTPPLRRRVLSFSYTPCVCYLVCYVFCSIVYLYSITKFFLSCPTHLNFTLM